MNNKNEFDNPVLSEGVMRLIKLKNIGLQIHKKNDTLWEQMHLISKRTKRNINPDLSEVMIWSFLELGEPIFEMARKAGMDPVEFHHDKILTIKNNLTLFCTNNVIIDSIVTDKNNLLKHQNEHMISFVSDNAICKK